MANFIIKNLCLCFPGIMIFLAGFVIGTLMDVLSFKIYKKWDPLGENIMKMCTSLFIHLFLVIFIIISINRSINLPKNIKLILVFFIYGLTLSQLFLFVTGPAKIASGMFESKFESTRTC